MTRVHDLVFDRVEETQVVWKCSRGAGYCDHAEFAFAKPGLGEPAASEDPEAPGGFRPPEDLETYANGCPDEPPTDPYQMDEYWAGQYVNGLSEEDLATALLNEAQRQSTPVTKLLLTRAAGIIA